MEDVTTAGTGTALATAAGKTACTYLHVVA